MHPLRPLAIEPANHKEQTSSRRLWRMLAKRLVLARLNPHLGTNDGRNVVFDTSTAGRPSLPTDTILKLQQDRNITSLAKEKLAEDT